MNPVAASLLVWFSVTTTVTTTPSEIPAPTVRLELTRHPGAESCPDQDALTLRVASRLGHNPFEPDAQNVVRVDLRRLLTQWQAQLSLQDSAGNTVGARTLHSGAVDCAELAAAVAVTLAVLLDAFAQAPPQAAQPAAPLPPAAAPAPPVVPPARVAPPRGPDRPRRARASPSPPPAQLAPTRFWGLELRGGAVTSIGPLPSLAAGPAAGVGLRLGAWSISAEAQAPLGAQTYKRGLWWTLSPSLTLSTCYRAGWLGGCGLASPGALAAGLLDAQRQQAAISPLLHAGGRTFVDLPLAPAVSMRLALDVTSPLLFTFLRVDGVDAWRTPRLHAQASSWLSFFL